MCCEGGRRGQERSGAGTESIRRREEIREKDDGERREMMTRDKSRGK